MADQFFGLTDTGKERKNNEDTFIAQQSADGRSIIACVIDGVGGYSGGEVAAALAREAILKKLAQPLADTTATLIGCFDLANQMILDGKKQVKEHDSMACVATLALVDVDHNQFYYVHVGDTRLYLLRDRSLVKITRDQSFVGFLEDSGRLDEKEAMAHPKRNEINKALGFEAHLSGNADYLETGQSPFLPGDMIMLCSDGLTDMVSGSDIAKILNNSSSLQDKCRDLVAAANNNGGKDNITVALVTNNKRAVTHSATMPVAKQKKNEPNSMTEAIAGDQATPVQRPEAKAKSSTATIIFGLLALLFLGTTVWQYLQKERPDKPIPVEQAGTQLVKQPNAQEVKLQNSIDQVKGNVLLLSDTAFKAPIVIGRAIQINRDTLFIKTKGNIQLSCDSGYTGAAFTLSPKCKLVMLDSLAINNFKIGISAYNNALLLKNIRFANCATAVQNLFTVQGKYTGGSIPAQVFKTDTIPALTHKQK